MCFRLNPLLVIVFNFQSMFDLGNSKKNFIIIIILFLIVVLIIIFFADKYTEVFVKNKDIADIMDITELTPTEEAKKHFLDRRGRQVEGVEEKNRKFLEEQKNTETKKEFIVAKEYKLKENDCDKIIDIKLKNNCYEYLKFEKAVANQDFRLCSALDSEWHDMCIFKVIERKRDDWDKCTNIKDVLIRNMCLKMAAIELNDLLICDKFSSGKQGCIDRTKAINNDWGGDIKGCKDIKKGEYFMMCVNMSGDECILLEDEYLVKRCESWRFFGNIITTGIKEDCIILPLDEFRKTCELYFDNGKKFIDSDGDGVEDNQELFCDTHPFIAEKEAKENLEHELKWGEVFDNIYYKVYNKLYDLMLDSDNDGLRDYEEKEIYHTIFDNSDTDGDGYDDGEEIKKGFNPKGEGKL